MEKKKGALMTVDTFLTELSWSLALLFTPVGRYNTLEFLSEVEIDAFCLSRLL